MRRERRNVGRSAAALGALAIIAAGGAQAQGEYDGGVVSVQVLVEDTPSAPRFVGVVHRAVIGPQREFELGGEPIQNDIYVVDGDLDFDGVRIVGSYPRSSRGGVFLEADFNGYVIVFEDACGVLDAEIVHEETNMALEDDDLVVEDGEIRLNVSGRAYGPEYSFVLRTTPAPCGVS